MLAQGDVCSYADFCASTIQDGLVFDYVPKLVAVCLNKEALNNRPLTASEFDDLRLCSSGIVVPLTARENLWQERYADIRDYADYRAASLRNKQE